MKELIKEAGNYSVPRQASARDPQRTHPQLPTQVRTSAPSSVSIHLCSFPSGCDIHTSNVRTEVRRPMCHPGTETKLPPWFLSYLSHSTCPLPHHPEGNQYKRFTSHQTGHSVQIHFLLVQGVTPLERLSRLCSVRKCSKFEMAEQRKHLTP